MVKNPIKVYGRLKPVTGKSRGEDYEIHHADEAEVLSFNVKPSVNYNVKPDQTIAFRFQKVFDPTANQEQVFDTVAKPVVDSVLQGYNGTIFAYGQTGSGKTFSMTGGLAQYADRGIIPRALQYLFHCFLEERNCTTVVHPVGDPSDHVSAGCELIDLNLQKNPTHTTYISYLEIYNECGYDLLNPNHKVSKLDDLPRVTLLEDTGGTLHLRNLSMHPVNSEKEALDLLFLGDTNRMISETPLNPSSSRSHCVFTVHVSIRSASGTTVRRSKLHLVDLAGSERVHKTGIDGNLLVEARYINLSLHFLEQVIVALADSRRSHVPYRNSMMTTVLRDSLGGNCMTAMLATLSTASHNIDETLSTCRFAQRVALVRNEAQLNEERDPHQEVLLLRADIRRLQEQIRVLTSSQGSANCLGMTEELTSDEDEECRRWVTEFLRGADEGTTVPVPSDPRKVRLCMSVLRDAAMGSSVPPATTTPSSSPTRSSPASCSIPDQQENAIEKAERLRAIVRQRDSEISILISLLRKEKQRNHAILRHPPVCPTEYEPVIERLTGQTFTLAEREAFKVFAADRKNRLEVEMTKKALKAKYEEAKAVVSTIDQCRNRIVLLHAEERQVPKSYRGRSEIELLQIKYRQALMDLQLLKVEAGHQKHAVEQAKLRLLRNFQNWWSAQSTQDILAVGSVAQPRPQSSQSPRQSASVRQNQYRPTSAGADRYASTPPGTPWSLWSAQSRSPSSRSPKSPRLGLSSPWNLSDDGQLAASSRPGTPWRLSNKPDNSSPPALNSPWDADSQDTPISMSTLWSPADNSPTPDSGRLSPILNVEDSSHLVNDGRLDSNAPDTQQITPLNPSSESPR